MKWISVKDRLPEKEGHILVLIKDKMIPGYAKEESTGELFISSDDYIYFTFRLKPKVIVPFDDPGWKKPASLCDVDFWMPLPKPPTNKV